MSFLEENNSAEENTGGAFVIIILFDHLLSPDHKFFSVHYYILKSKSLCGTLPYFGKKYDREVGIIVFYYIQLLYLKYSVVKPHIFVQQTRLFIPRQRNLCHVTLFESNRICYLHHVRFFFKVTSTSCNFE